MQCGCGYIYGTNGVSTRCYMQCSGNASEICGGPDTYSVYSTLLGNITSNLKKNLNIMRLSNAFKDKKRDRPK